MVLSWGDHQAFVCFCADVGELGVAAQAHGGLETTTRCGDCMTKEWTEYLYGEGNSPAFKSSRERGSWDEKVVDKVMFVKHV